jgi:CRP-like cAMP-binding protein
MPVTLNEARLCPNRLLARLSDEHMQALCPLLERVHTDVKDVLHERNQAIDHVHFPYTCSLSNLIILLDGTAIEVGTVGNEGFSGVELLANASAATETCICQIEGESLRMTGRDFQEAVKGSSPLRRIGNCYLQTYLAALSQSVACNRKHSLEARFARWLLITHDRVQGQDFTLTHEFLADMLGAQRPSVSVVAAAFQKAGILQYSRGHVKILDRAQLEATACECYECIREQFERVLGVPHG